MNHIKNTNEYTPITTNGDINNNISFTERYYKSNKTNNSHQ
jgi:hypothetical protein